MTLSKQQLGLSTLAFIAGLLLLSPASAEEPGDKTINTGCYTVVTNSSFRVNSPFGANGPKAQRMVETAAKKWSELFVEYDYGWGGPTFRPLPADLSNPCENQTSSPEDIVELDPVYCAIKDFSDCSMVTGCDADKRQCPLEVCYGVDSNLNYNTPDWPTVPGTNCQVQWQSAAYDIDNNQILVGPVFLGEDIEITGGTMVPENWDENYSKAAVFINQDKTWHFNRYNYSAYASETVVEEAIREVITAFENEQYNSSDEDGELRDLFETMLHEFGHVVGLQHTTEHLSGSTPLSIMRPEYYVGPVLRAYDIAAAQGLFMMSSQEQDLDVAVSLMTPTLSGEKHQHLESAFAIPANGEEGSGILDVAYTLENRSNIHSADVRVSYCKSGENETCLPADEIASENIYLEPSENLYVGKLLPHSETTLPSELFIIAEVTKIDNVPATENPALRWNNGPAWSLDLETTRGICGDANSDGVTNVSDAVYLVNYVFNGGRFPQPLLQGNANNDDTVNVSDAVYLLNYVFKAGPPPEGIGCTPPPM